MKSRILKELIESSSYPNIKIGDKYKFNPEENMMDKNFPIVKKGKRIKPGTEVVVLNVDFDSKNLLANIMDKFGNVMTVHKVSLE